ncbi:MAG TPA: Zn-dependent alcohol dehydrogenase [Solirubrobacterales bacterium]|nr:Zn-dependent alcohol dehydrogenase [Solirubrobacterales bacterium]
MTARFEGRTMRAAVMREVGEPLTIEQLEIAEPGPGEVLVKLAASGVCHSDLHTLKGEWQAAGLPVVLGHEGAGVVEAVGEGVQRVAVGDPVVLSWTAGCGRCMRCLIGQPNLCENALESVHSFVMYDGTTRLRKDGEEIYSFLAVASFGEYAVVPENGAIRVADGVSLELASVVGCAVSTGVGAATNTVSVPAGASTAIIGLGGVGLSVLQGCVAQSASPVIAIDMHEDKLQAASRLGATHTINAADGDPVAAVSELTGGAGVDYAFEAIGLKVTIEQTLAMLGTRGTAVLVGMPPEGVMFEADPLAITNLEQRIVGSNYGSTVPAVDFPRILRLAEADRLDLSALITQRLPLDRINEAFEAMERGEGIRTVITYG